jgi:hypothetical protein
MALVRRYLPRGLPFLSLLSLPCVEVAVVCMGLGLTGVVGPVAVSAGGRRSPLPPLRFSWPEEATVPANTDLVTGIKNISKTARAPPTFRHFRLMVVIHSLDIILLLSRVGILAEYYSISIWHREEGKLIYHILEVRPSIFSNRQDPRSRSSFDFYIKTRSNPSRVARLP